MGEVDMFGLANDFGMINCLTITSGDQWLPISHLFQPNSTPSYALRINSQKAPLDDLHVRFGIHHSMNFQLVMDKIFKFVRMNLLRMATVIARIQPYEPESFQTRRRNYSPKLTDSEDRMEFWSMQGGATVGGSSDWL